MAHGPRYAVPFRRRLEGKTDYRTRIRLLRSGKHRAVVRRSLNGVTVQVVGFSPEGDRVVAHATGGHLRKLGWNYSTSSTSAAYLTGFMAGKAALKAGVTEAVLDIGLNNPSRGARVFASLKGLLDAGLAVPHGEGVLPKDDRIRGGHLTTVPDKAEFQKRFGEIREKIVKEVKVDA